ncbi:hypothetical protein [Rickettsia endosymbiont of Nabis limbatus]
MDFTEIFCYVDDFFQELDKHTNSITVIAKVKGTSKLHEKGTREFGVT